MKNFAVINDGVVENCIIADSIEVAQGVTGKNCVEYDSTQDVSIGFSYSDGVFTNPNPFTPVDEAPEGLVPPIE